MNSLFLNSRIKLSNGLLFWREAGSGTPVVLLHGAWSDGSEWVSMMEFLSLDCHCFAPDLLGFGESESPNTNYSIDLQVDCLAEFLRALKLERVYLVGHSLGGWIAASFAIKYPDLVAGMVLVAPEGVDVDSKQKYYLKMQRIVKRSPFIFGLLRWLRPVFSIFGWGSKVEEEWRLRQKLLENPVASQMLYLRRSPEIESELLQNSLYGIDAPVLILQGGKDSPEAQAMSKAYAQLLMRSNLKVIAHGESNLPTSCTGVVAGEIRDFLKGVW
jgi:pimeloyl-ACP methyl ester carboxylesterase